MNTENLELAPTILDIERDGYVTHIGLKAKNKDSFENGVIRFAAFGKTEEESRKWADFLLKNLTTHKV